VWEGGKPHMDAIPCEWSGNKEDMEMNDFREDDIASLDELVSAHRPDGRKRL
jgi:hypothetical protein